MEELTKTVSGKIKRAVLRSREIERKTGKGGSTAGRYSSGVQGRINLTPGRKIIAYISLMRS